MRLISAVLMVSAVFVSDLACDASSAGSGETNKDIFNTPDLGSGAQDTYAKPDGGGPSQWPDAPDGAAKAPDAAGPADTGPSQWPDAPDGAVKSEDAAQPKPDSFIAPDSVLPGGLTCMGVIECYQQAQCDPMAPDECGVDCASQAGGKGQAEWTALWLCGVEHCAGNPEKDCVFKQCMAQFVACVSGEGDATCHDTLLCAVACPKGPNGEDGGCGMACLEEASEEAADLYVQMFQCPGQDICIDKLIECLGGNGDLSCGDSIACQQNCNQGPGGPGGPPQDGENTACQFDCFSQTSPEGQQDLIDFFHCVEEQCPPNPEKPDGGFWCDQALLCIGECPDFPMGGPGGP